MEKKKVRQQITDYTLEWYGQIEIEALKKDIAELEKRGALTVDIESDAYVYTTAFFYRDETDEEFARRIEHEEKSKSRRQAFERAEYERLKQKFEKS